METKKCGKCGENLPNTEEFFAIRKLKTKVVLQSFCRKCQKKYRREHYIKNKQKYINKSKKYKIDIVSWFINEIKSKLKCKKCGENRFWVLDFHHKEPNVKENNISKMINNASKEKILNEIKKCDVYCANCHRDLHYQEKINAR